MKQIYFDFVGMSMEWGENMHYFPKCRWVGEPENKTISANWWINEKV